MLGGKAVIVVGGTGMGKTTLNKYYLRQVNKECIWLYDVNNEYTEFVPPNYVLPKFDVFCEKASKLSQAVMLFEEATIFLSNKGSNRILIDILVRKRHTQNVIFLVFHSLRFVPKYLLDLCNLMVLLKTNDPEHVVKAFEHEALLNAYTELKKSPMLLNKELGKYYSPHKFVKLLD
jgi:hypothetical protein